MRNVIIHGSRTGKFNLIYYSNSTPQSINAYDSNILSVAALNESKTEVLWYRPGQNNNPFVSFEPTKLYLIFAKKTFTLQLEDYDITQTQSLTGDSVGRYNFALYPFTTNRPISSFNNAVKEVHYISPDSSILTSYLSGRSLNQFNALQQNVFLIKATSDIILYNYDLPAMLTENEQFILLEQNNDRILL